MTAQTFSFDWDTVAWTPGGTSGSFANVGGSGIDVTINITGGTFILGSPVKDSTTLTGGLVPAQDSLLLAINEGAVGNGLNFSLGFSGNVQNLTLNFFDVDTGTGAFFNRTFRDELTFATTPTTIVTGATNLVFPASSSTVLGNNPATNTTSDGDVSAIFAGPTSSVNFFYGAGPATQANPDQQAIGFYDFTFEVAPIPEPGTIFMGASLVLFCLYQLKRRKPGGL